MELMPATKPAMVIADRAYDADWLLFYLDAERIRAVIPSKRNRKWQRSLDREAYKLRNVIERTINRLKQYRKIATRYEKTSASFLSLCYLAATLINLSL